MSTPKERALQLLEAGREVGADMMSNAVSTAKNSEQMMNQINTLRAMSIHILATTVYNQVAQGQQDPNECLALIHAALADEYDLMTQSQEIELCRVGETEDKDRGFH